MRAQNEQVVVVGAGVVGAAVAYHLALRGSRVLVLEQFELGHKLGSSHGAARITRHSYASAADAVLMPRAFAAWRELEADACVPLYVRTGAVSFCPPRLAYVADVSSNLRALGVAHQRTDGARWNARNRLFGLPADYDVVFEPDGGMILATKARNAMLALAQAQGAQVLERAAVLDVAGDGTGARVTFRHDGTSREIRAEWLVIAAGGWAATLVRRFDRRLIPTLQHVFYLERLPGGASGIGQLPAFIYKGECDTYYGMPDFSGSGVKAARDGGPELDLGAAERTVGETDRAELARFLQRHLPGLADCAVIAEETCVYTMQDEHRFVVGPLEAGSRVILASACSGHGFKFSCLVGRSIAGLLHDGVPLPEAWLAPWRA